METPGTGGGFLGARNGVRGRPSQATRVLLVSDPEGLVLSALTPMANPTMDITIPIANNTAQTATIPVIETEEPFEKRFAKVEYARISTIVASESPDSPSPVQTVELA